MPLAIVRSRGVDGLAAPAVAVEVHLSPGLPSVTLVGLPDTEVKEARDRVRAAIVNSGFEFPTQRITINLAPADLPKESGRFDLPIALGILAASGQISADQFKSLEFAGELSLSGQLRPIRGALAMVLAKDADKHNFILPTASAAEAALARPDGVFAADSLLVVCAHLRGVELLKMAEATASETPADYPDLSDVRGQAPVKRALEIAAAGGHSLLMTGPPGSGKSMLAARLPGLLPPLPRSAALESAAVLSLVGQFRPSAFAQRIYRSPHHSSSSAALVGGGSTPRPGEISLAHHGVLFLDELPEFDRRVLESLREPLESGSIHISRAARQAEFPARFQLIAAMNPCPCGWHGDRSGRCRCTPDQVTRYGGKLSGPLLDRIDLYVDVPAVPPAALQEAPTGEPSVTVRERVTTALARQEARQGKPNARLSSKEIDRHCVPDAAGSALLEQAATRLGLSVRGFHRVQRVARTIADLAGAEQIGSAHIAEAVQLRRPVAAN